LLDDERPFAYAAPMAATTTAELKRSALGMAAALDPSTMSGEAAAQGVAELALAEKAIATARMFLAVRVAQTDAWRGQGFASPADWLAAKAGISVTEAGRQLGTAKRADRLPRTKEAMRRGKLSPTQADAVTDAASVDPDAEDELLDAAANDTTKGLRDLAGRRKAAATSSRERDERIRRHRSLRRGTDAEGAFWARLYGPGSSAAAFEELIKPFEELVFRQHRAAGISSTFENRSFDAFFAMLAFLRHAEARGPGGKAAAGEEPPPSAPCVAPDRSMASDPPDPPGPADPPAPHLQVPHAPPMAPCEDAPLGAPRRASARCRTGVAATVGTGGAGAVAGEAARGEQRQGHRAGRPRRPAPGVHGGGRDVRDRRGGPDPGRGRPPDPS